MRFELLKKGMTIVNYRELCQLLEMEICAGNEKKSQLKELDRFVRYDKQGQKFIIQEIYKIPLEMVDGRLFSPKILPFIDNMELLLLDFLVYCDGDVTISKTGLYKILSMVNDRYAEYNGVNKKKLSIDKSITYDEVREFYSVSSKMFNDAILTVLNRLERKKLIFHQKVKMVVKLKSKPIKKNKLDHTQDISIDKKYEIENIDYVVNTKHIATKQTKVVADDETIRKILLIERQVLGSMGLNTETKKSYLQYSSRYEEYIKKVNKLLTEQLDIAWSYDAFKIIFNMNYVIEERNYLLTTSRNSLQLDTNGKVIAQLKKKLEHKTTEKTVDYFALINDLISEVVKINRA